MLVPKSFDPTRCFVNRENKLTREPPKIKLPEDKSFSLVLAYFYTILKHPKDQVVVDDRVYHAVTKYFPKEFFLILKASEYVPVDNSESEEETERDRVWRIRQVMATEAGAYYIKGDLLMATYTSEENVLIYNVYSDGSDVIEYNTEHILGALKYFNGVVRGSGGGTAKHIYIDPVIQSTKLRYNYDQMFGLWLADKYLQTMGEGKYVKTPQSLDEPLAQCMGLLEVIRKASAGLLDKEVVVRVFDGETMANSIMIDLASDLVEDVTIRNVSLPNREYKSNLFSTLYFLLIESVGTTNFTLYVTKFNTYNHLAKVLEYFPGAKIIVHDESKTASVPKGIELNTTVILPATIRKLRQGSKDKILLISGLEHNDALVKALTENTQDNAALVLYTSVSFQPLYTFASLFTPLTGYKGYSVFHDAIKSTLGPQNVITARFRKSLNLLVQNYRDTNKWSYTMEKGGPEMSFDEVYLTLVEANASLDPNAELSEVEKSASSQSSRSETESSESN
jgi:hypothetical protein